MDGFAGAARRDHGSYQPRGAKVQISCVSFDKKGRVIIHNGHNIEIPTTELGAAGDARLGIPLNQCNPDPRAVRVRVVVEAFDTGKIGAAHLDLADAAAK